MAEVTYYIALPFITDGGVAAGEPTECFNSIVASSMTTPPNTLTYQAAAVR
jgi:hypothetical protein